MVDADEEGISVTALAQVLANWDSKNGPFPKVLYTVPVSDFCDLALGLTSDIPLSLVPTQQE